MDGRKVIMNDRAKLVNEIKSQGCNSTAWSWSQKNRLIPYTVHIIPQLRRKYHVGQRITITKITREWVGVERITKIRKTYSVAGIYPHVLALKDRNGIVECFGYVELEIRLKNEGCTNG